MAEKLLGRKELAEQLSVSGEQVRRLVKAKKITGGYTVGSHTKYLLSEVLQQLSVKPTEGDQQ